MQIKQGACFRYPPQATNYVNNIGQTISLCCRPTVMDDNGACGEHEYALDYTDAEVAGKEE